MQSVSQSPAFIPTIKSIKRDAINTTPENHKELIDALTTWVSTYTDLSLAKSSVRCGKFWEGLRGDESLEIEIKKCVEFIVQVQKTDHKIDATLSKYLQRILECVNGDTCSGFMIEDTRTDKSVSTIQHLRSDKERWITSTCQSFLANGSTGWVFATEIDQRIEDYALPDNMRFFRFDSSIHKGNSSKGMFYTSDIELEVLPRSVIKREMKDYPKMVLKYDKFQEKFVVFKLRFHGKTVYVIGVHLKSTTKFDSIADNKEEYQFINALVKSFTQYPLVLQGDFNIPVWGEGSNELNISKAPIGAEMFYPLHPTGDTDIHFNSGLTRLTYYDTKKVASKCRSDNCFENNQAIGGKFGPRTYNTDHSFANPLFMTLMNIDSITSDIYDSFTTNTSVILPKMSDDAIWKSDHQITWTQMKTKENVIKILNFNVLSNDCSRPPNIKSTFSQSEIKQSQKELEAILNMIVFDICK